MKLINLEKAGEFEVREYFRVHFKFNSEQLEKLKFIKFKFYKKRKIQKVKIIYRFSIILIPIYFLILLLIIFLKYLFTGNRYLGEKIYKFHCKWINSLNIQNILL